MTTLDFTDVVTVLRQSHDAFAATVAAMTPAEVSAPSYCADWTIGRVLSHMGSGAEIATGSLSGARGGAPGEEAKDIWARWDALDDPAAAAEYRRSEAAFLAGVESVGADEAANIQVQFFTGPIPLVNSVAIRLHEHTTHRWDVDVMADPAAELNSAASAAILTVLPGFVPFIGKPDQAPELVGHVFAIDLGAPHGVFTLDLRDGASVTPGAPEQADGRVRMSAEAFLRLLTGRLDEAHTPAGVETEGGVTLDALRRLFPGY